MDIECDARVSFELLRGLGGSAKSPMILSYSYDFKLIDFQCESEIVLFIERVELYFVKG